jgi:cell division protein FtsL
MPPLSLIAFIRQNYLCMALLAALIALAVAVLKAAKKMRIK